MSDPRQDVYTVLKQVFGFDEFRGAQEAAVCAVLNGQSTLLLMPTGMGKSLCFQLPARVLGGLTLVISPLIALMKDQVDAAVARGLRASFINSSLSPEERSQRYRRLARGEYELLYVTPERFRNLEFRDALDLNRLSLLAIDEAHCISSWGHDFRPDYSRLGEYRRELGNPVTIALTATATLQVQEDILQQLHLDRAECLVINEGLDRPNLAVSVLDVSGTDEKIRALVALRYQNPGNVIVYFSLIQTLRLFSDELSRLGLTHLTYHGQLQDRERRRSQDLFIKGSAGGSGEMILATPAFGLGVDKADVRLVVHAEIPGSLEAYYQEIGRAGRDGLRSDCILLYDGDDVSIQSDFLKWGNPDPGFIQSVYNLIDRNLARARAEGLDYLRTQMNFYNRRDYRAETAVNLLERWGSLEGRQPRDWKTIAPPPEDYLDLKLYEARMRAAQSKLLQMVDFTRNEVCRMLQIKTYFGFPNEKRCGICDICLRDLNVGET